MDNHPSRFFGSFRSLLLAGLLLAPLCAFAAPPALHSDGTRASLSGVVKDSAGRPQMGATIEVFTSAAAIPLVAFTDATGHYNIASLLPGTYFVKATAASFLPAMRERVNLSSGAHAVVDLTLSTLFEAIHLIPNPNIQHKDDDDWRWTLRSAARRPILRVLDDGSPLLVSSTSDAPADRTLKARVTFVTGSDEFSGSESSTAFRVEQSMFSTGMLSFNGEVGNGSSTPAGSIRATYRHELANGQRPEVSFTARRFASPDTALHHAALTALALSMSDGFSIADFLDLHYGTELQSIQFRGHVLAARPFGSVDAHFGHNAVLEYRYASSRPNSRADQTFDAAPADLSESDPRVSLSNDAAKIERARHQEVSLSLRRGRSRAQLAYFADSVRDPALYGVGDVSSISGDFLPDLYSGNFTYSAPAFHTHGTRVVIERDLADGLTATIAYAYGATLDSAAHRDLADGTTFSSSYHHAVTAKIGGTAPLARTRWNASYKWTSGHGAITPVDQFNSAAGMADPYFSLYFRQPIPSCAVLPMKLEALVDVRNLLAQGYVPMLGADGRTLYLVQAPRSVRGGLAFNF